MPWSNSPWHRKRQGLRLLWEAAIVLWLSGPASWPCLVGGRIGCGRSACLCRVGFPVCLCLGCGVTAVFASCTYFQPPTVGVHLPQGMLTAFSSCCPCTFYSKLSSGQAWMLQSLQACWRKLACHTNSALLRHRCLLRLMPWVVCRHSLWAGSARRLVGSDGGVVVGRWSGYTV